MIPGNVDFYGDQSRWFMGEVVDINDPLQLARIKVRVYGIHSSKILDRDLPWAQTVTPITEGGTAHLGNPLGVQVNALVFGVFLDGPNSQLPLILGSLPKYEDLEEPDDRLDKSVSLLARGTNTIEKTPDEVIEEPESPYAAKYPYNYVHRTPRGHVIEIDDTYDSDGEGGVLTNHERIHIYHRSGTFIEMHPNGDVVTQHKNGWRSVTGNDKLHVTGNMDIFVDGDMNITVKGNVNETVSGNVSETVSGSQSTQISGNLDVDAARIDLN
jgi:hypothetical protein